MSNICEICGSDDDYCSHCSTCHACLNEEIDRMSAKITELENALNEAADDIVDCANYYNNDSTVVVTEAHEEADKYRAIAKGEEQ